MAKLLVAVSLLFGGTAAMGIYGGEKNGCGEPCADVVAISSPSFPAIQDGTCYVVEDTFPSGAITVTEGVECAKITVPKGSGLFEIRAHSSVFLFAPRPTKR